MYCSSNTAKIFVSQAVSTDAEVRRYAAQNPRVAPIKGLLARVSRSAETGGGCCAGVNSFPTELYRRRGVAE